MSIDQVAVRSEIEPVAAANASHESEFIASIAISLKRIADALCEGTAAIHVHLNTDGVAGGALDFSDVAFRAGVAFQNGVNNAR